MTKELSYQKYDPSWGLMDVPPIPEVPLFIMMQESAKKQPEKPAIIFLDKVTTYRELDQLSDRCALSLIGLGIKQGDRVATMLPNCTQHIIILYGILKAGGIVVPFNPMLKGDEISYIIKDSGAKMVVTLDLLYPMVKPLADKIGSMYIITVHAKDFSASGARVPTLLSGEKKLEEGAIDFMQLIGEDKGKPCKIDINPKKDLAFIIYTSGTTGVPKGAMITHYNFNASGTIDTVAGISSNDIIYGIFPIFHAAGAGGLAGLISTMYHGGTYIPISMFDAGDALDLIQRYKVSVIALPPTAYIALLNHEDFFKYNLASLRFTMAAAAPVPSSLQDEWQEKVGTYLVNGYGCTETSATAPGIVQLENKKKDGALGVTTGELKIVDEKRNIVPKGTTGELVHRGPGVVLGYWGKPEETRKQFDEDGWWYSGDAGYMDEEGFVYFIERIKDLIVASGYNIAPVEVENYIYKHPAVQEVAVVGIPDKYRGETVKAYIVLKSEFIGKVSEDDIIQFCRDNMAVYKAPKKIEFLDSLPKTAAGKVLRRLLREK